MLLRKGVLKIYSKFTREHPWRSVILIKLQSSFIEITRRYGCSPAYFLAYFQNTFSYEHIWAAASGSLKSNLSKEITIHVFGLNVLYDCMK